MASARVVAHLKNIINQPDLRSIISDGGMNTAGSNQQQAQGIDDSPQRMYPDMLTAGQGLNCPALAIAVFENSVETLEWARAFLGVKFKILALVIPANNLSFLMQGLATTFKLALVSITGGLLPGIVVGMARLSSIKAIYFIRPPLSSTSCAVRR